MPNAAIVIIDMQKDFFWKDYKDQVFSKEVERAVMAGINRLLPAARAARIPVAHVITEYKADGSDWTLRMKDIHYQVCIEGTPGVDLVDGLQVEAGDRVVKKNRYSGFCNTGLDETLNKMGVDTLIACGINAHACVRTTVIDAFMRDYRVFVPRECVGCYDLAHQEITFKYISNRIAKVVGLDEMIARIERGDLVFCFE